MTSRGWLTAAKALALALGAAIPMQPTQSASDTVKVLADTPIRPALVRVAPRFKSSSGHDIDVGYDSAPAIERRLAAGERAHVVISLAPDIEKKRAAGTLQGVEVGVARIKLGLAASPGAVIPDISTIDRFGSVLESAEAVLHNNVASGRAFLKQLEGAGLLERLRAKLVEVPVPPGVFPELAKRSGNHFGVGQMTQII